MSAVRCILVPVIDRRICEVMGGQPWPEDLFGPYLPPNGVSQGGEGSRYPPVLPFATLADVVQQPGVQNLEDPDERGVWIWDLD